MSRKKAIVTGGTSGLGLACARRLRAGDVEVITVDIASDPDLRVDVSDWTSVESVAKKVGAVDILVNSAGMIESPMVDATPPEGLEYIRSRIPMQRFGRPEELAELVAWLASEKVGFSTGAVYEISGGRATY